MIQLPLSILILAALVLFGVIYAAAVRYIRRRHPDHGYTAFLVMIGNGVIVAAFAIVQGADAAIYLLYCMVAAGAPMIVEYTAHILERSESRHMAEVVRDFMEE